MELNKAEFKSILEACLRDGLDLIINQIEEDTKSDWKYTFDYHDNYPTMSTLSNGMPSFFLNSHRKKDFSKFLTKENKYLKNDTWHKFHNYIISNEILRRYFGILEYGPFDESATQKSIEFYSKIFTYFFIADFTDSYIHKSSFQFDYKVYENLFELYYNSIINEKLEIEIAVPILLADFDFEEFNINDNISIKKLSNDIQLARNTRKSYTTSAHETVIGAATHAFYLKGWFVENDNLNQIEKSLIDLGALKKPLEIINNLFATLRLACNIETGYCQIISIPVNWQYRTTADLSEIFVTSEKKYPDKFDNYGWSIPLSKISIDALQNFKYIYEQLNKKQYSIAIKRLNSASLRKNDEDSIIDITIALESLLTNDSTSEITYRLAARASQICKLERFKDFNAQQVFELCKKIYNYRSAVVHGDIQRIEKTKTIVNTESKEIEIIKVSIDLFKHILMTMLKNEIKDCNSIDLLML